MFSAETLKSVEAQIVEKCDAIDGVKDGLMQDPRRCTADVSALTGLTQAQKLALRRIYGATRNPDGSTLMGQPFGGEGEGAGWSSWIVGPNPLLKLQNAPSLRYAFGTEMYKYFVFNDPAWDYTKYSFSTFKKDTAQAASILNATDPNLDGFKASGGKLLVWHGWSDPALSAFGTIDYYDKVVARDASARDFVRLFMLPGVLHCAGGPGPDRVDWAAVIDEWVEKGTAPERLVARKEAGGKVTRTRPLCAYPMRAVYKGTGSLDDEASFTCGK